MIQDYLYYIISEVNELDTIDELCEFWLTKEDKKAIGKLKDKRKMIIQQLKENVKQFNKLYKEKIEKESKILYMLKRKD